MSLHKDSEETDYTLKNVLYFSLIDPFVFFVNKTTFTILTYLTYLSTLCFILGYIASCLGYTSFS